MAVCGECVGVPERNRTDDIQLGKLTLYQPSYGHSIGRGETVDLPVRGVKVTGQGALIVGPFRAPARSGRSIAASPRSRQEG